MLLAFIALIAMLNALIGSRAPWPATPTQPRDDPGPRRLADRPPHGRPTQDCWTVGKLIGVKTVLNEFVAYLQLTDILKTGQPLTTAL